jgi:quinol monooxygenase YgiN
VYCYVWEYEVREEHLQAFERVYGPGGEWVRLFRRDPEYLRTDLLRSNDAPARFITVDVWTSRESCLAFRDQFTDEFEALDRACEVMTRRETHIGDFSLVS